MALLWAAPTPALINVPVKHAHQVVSGQQRCPAQLGWQPCHSRPGQAQFQVKQLQELRALPTGTDASQQSAVDGPAVFGTVSSVDKDTFWPLVAAAGDKLVVVDIYTQWCGPCKVIAPKLDALSREYTDVLFLKLDCNQLNKPLAKELGVRVVPTFKLFRHSKVVAQVGGAKYQELVKAIDVARIGS